jgi:lipoic acid synthetase
MALTVLPSDQPKEAPRNRPPWLRVKAPHGDVFEKVRHLRESLKLHTVCESAACPNLGECWGRGTATFMINGNKCTRACRFCDVQSGRPDPIDPTEADRVAQMTEALGLKFVVITAVTRDDLPDGGSAAFAEVLRALARRVPDCGREVLIPDFDGQEAPLKTVLDANPHVLNHNLETSERLTPRIRSGAEYRRSLRVLANSKRLRPDIMTKSGIMLGLGETDDEIDQCLRDLREHHVESVTLGQYLQPSSWHRPVDRCVTPEDFQRWGARARELGFTLVASGPLVRSSYHAEHAQEALRQMAGLG